MILYIRFLASIVTNRMAALRVLIVKPHILFSIVERITTISSTMYILKDLYFGANQGDKTLFIRLVQK